MPHRPGDRPLRARWHVRVLAACGLLLAVELSLALSPTAVERYFTEGIGYYTSGIVSALSGTVTVSLAEWIEGGLVLLLIWSFASGVRAMLRRERSARNTIGAWGLNLLTLTAVVVVVFYGVWGLNYARAPAAQRLGLDEVDLGQVDDPTELRALVEELVTVVNELYVAIHGSTDAQVPTEPPPTDEIDRAVDEGFERVAEAFALHPTFAESRGPAKPLLSSTVFSYLGIGGYYFPFTGEANFNRLPPRWGLPHTIAHEKAHQRAVASEDEANFFGFLACVYSSDLHLRYAGYLFAQRQLMRVLLQVDPDETVRLYELRHPGVQRDLDARRAFWASYDGAVSELGQSVNDAYLKVNRVEGGTLSYSRSAALMVALARQRDATIVLPEPLDPS